jgi:hypothetical protein
VGLLNSLTRTAPSFHSALLCDHPVSNGTFLVLACYIGSDLLTVAIERDGERRSLFLRSTLPWLAAGFGCLAVTFINPYGWGLRKHIVEYILDPYYRVPGRQPNRRRRCCLSYNNSGWIPDVRFFCSAVSLQR